MSREIVCSFWEVIDETQGHDRPMRNVATGEVVRLNDLPLGAMYYADWLFAIDGYKERSPDGHVLIVRTPAGFWNVDSESSSGSVWKRTGAPPNVTATPSILITRGAGYHGWLRDGRLVEC